jgi:hypothetical protein
MKSSVFVISLLAVTILPDAALPDGFPLSNGIYCDAPNKSLPSDDNEYGDGILRIEYPLVRYNYSYCEITNFKQIDEDYKVVLSCSTEDEDIETKDLWTIKSNQEFELAGKNYSRCSDLTTATEDKNKTQDNSANKSANSGTGWTDYFSMGTTEYSNSNDRKDAVRLSNGQIAGENTTCSLAFERGGEHLSERSVVAVTIGTSVYQLPTQDGVFSPTSKKELDQLHKIISDLTKPDTNSFSVAESASAFSADFQNNNSAILNGSLDGCDSIEQSSSNNANTQSDTAPSVDRESPITCSLRSKVIDCNVVADSAEIGGVTLNRGRCTADRGADLHPNIKQLLDKEWYWSDDTETKTWHFGDRFHVGFTDCDNLLEFRFTANGNEWIWKLN